MTVIGITGTLGAGKGTIVDYLVQQKGYAHFSVRAFLLEEIRKRGLPENRDSMVMVANELRQQNSPSFITDQLFEQSLKQNNNSIIESIRTPGEAESLRTKGEFYLFAVDADPKIRYERIKLRNSETDQIDFATFIANEKREMTTTDPNKQNLKKCREMADFIFLNDGSRDDLFQAVERVINNIDKSSKK